MTITELLEEDRERLLGQLERAGTPERAEAVLSEELQKLLLRYNQAEDSDRRRTAAAGMTETLQSGLALMDTAGETRIWESELRQERRISPLAAAALAAGVVLGIVSTIVLLDRELPLPLALLPVLGCLLAGLGGAFLRAVRGPEAAPERKIEVIPDWQKVYRTLYAAGLVIDRNLSETESGLLPAIPAGASGEENVEQAELELFGSLLEAQRSGDGEFALDRLEQLRHYLHSRGIETVDYSDETAAWFDRMPSVRRETLRPALARDGKLLLRGLAAEGE